MEKTKFDEVMKMLENVKHIVKTDNYDLTRDDHDAIAIRVNALKQFIQQAYESHRTKKED